VAYDSGTREYPSGGARDPGSPGPMPPVDEQPPWTRGWFVALLIVLLAIVIIGVVSLLGDDAGDQPRADVPAGAGTPEESAEPEEPEDEEPPDDAEDPGAVLAVYPEFEVMNDSGTGDAVVPLPEGATAALVAATHDGEREFTVTVVHPDDPTSNDALVSVFGPYSGVTAYGLSVGPRPPIGLEPPVLEISADGFWSVGIAPVASAPMLSLPASGTGDAVFLYEGDAVEWAVTHSGVGDFVVAQYGGATPGVLARQTGAFQGTVTPEPFPSPIVIRADGAWTVAGA